MRKLGVHMLVPPWNGHSFGGRSRSGANNRNEHSDLKKKYVMTV